MDVSENSLRGDHHLQFGGQTVAHVLFSDRVADGGANSGQDFGVSGQFYLAPPTASLLGNTDFRGQLQLWYRVGEAVSSVSGASALIASLENGTATISQINKALVDDGFGADVPVIDASRFV
ncbi:MAG: hypothetical protein R3C28_28360 [Pirellulaceae bacterium]